MTTAASHTCGSPTLSRCTIFKIVHTFLLNKKRSPSCKLVQFWEEYYDNFSIALQCFTWGPLMSRYTMVWCRFFNALTNSSSSVIYSSIISSLHNIGQK